MNPNNELKHEAKTLIHNDESIVKLNHKLWTLSYNNENDQSREKLLISEMNYESKIKYNYEG
jgi:hypothetical protein